MSTNGKGDRDRSDPKKFAQGYDRIFSRCPKHPKYRAMRRPRADCEKCWEIWKRKFGDIV